MNTLTFVSDHKPTTLRWLKSISIAASLFIFANVANAGYSVLSGIPITQGQMRLNERDFETVKAATPKASPTVWKRHTSFPCQKTAQLTRIRFKSANAS